jgi:hypothetical protein
MLYLDPNEEHALLGKTKDYLWLVKTSEP